MIWESTDARAKISDFGGKRTEVKWFRLEIWNIKQHNVVCVFLVLSYLKEKQTLLFLQYVVILYHGYLKIFIEI